MAAGAVLTMVGKPLATAAAKKFIDDYFNPKTARMLKGLLGEQEDPMPKLREIEEQVRAVHALVRENLWVTSWISFNTSVAALHALVADLISRRKKFSALSAQHAAELQAQTASDAVKSAVQKAGIEYHKSCVAFIKSGGGANLARQMISNLGTTLPNLKTSLMEYSASLLLRDLADVVTYTDTMNGIVGYTMSYLLLAHALFEEASAFHAGADGLDYPGKPKPSSIDSSIELDAPSVVAMMARYVALTKGANTLAVRLEELAASKLPVGLRSARWPVAQIKDYDCYLTGFADGTQLSENSAIGTGGNHAKMVTEYKIGINQNRLLNGMPMLFVTPKATGAVYRIREVTDTAENDFTNRFNEANRTLGKLVPKYWSYDEEDAVHRRRLRGRHDKIVHALDFIPFAKGVHREIRDLEFRNDRDSQSWVVEREAADGQVYYLFRHKASGMYLGAMRQWRAYLTMDLIQRRWQPVCADRDGDYKGGNEADKVLFILRSCHDVKKALVCNFNCVLANETPNPTAGSQQFQLITWE